MPSLDGRYAHSLSKGEAARATSVAPRPPQTALCLADCGTEVGPGQKCVPCATAATLAWTERIHASRMVKKDTATGVMVWDKKAGVLVPKKKPTGKIRR